MECQIRMVCHNIFVAYLLIYACFLSTLLVKWKAGYTLDSSPVFCRAAVL